MPINPSIALQVQGLDPNGFINALAAGQKQRELQNASDRLDLAENRLARKDEAAVRKNNALSKFGSSGRTEADRAAVWAVDPASGMALDKAAAEGEKNTTEAAYNKVRTDKLTSEATTKKIGVIRELVNSVADEASYQAVNAQVHQLWPDAERWPDRYDPAFIDITKRRFTTVKQALDQRKADQSQAKEDEPTIVDGQYVYPQDPTRPAVPIPNFIEPEKAPPAPKYAKTPQGLMLMDPENPAAPGPIVEGTAPKPKAPTEGQARTGMLVGEAQLANTTMKDLEAKGYDPTSKTGALIDRVADMGGMTTSWLASPEGQTYLSAAREFVASAAYGKSGATLTESEWENGRQTYIPMPGDSKERRAFKAAARAKAMQGMQIQAGPAYRPHGAPGDATPHPDTSPSLAKPQMVHSAADYAKLPSGTIYTAPDGSVRTKP